MDNVPIGCNNGAGIEPAAVPLDRDFYSCKMHANLIYVIKY